MMSLAHKTDILFNCIQIFNAIALRKAQIVSILVLLSDGLIIIINIPYVRAIQTCIRLF